MDNNEMIPEIHSIGGMFAFIFRHGKTAVHTSKLYPSMDDARHNAGVFKDSMGWA